MELSKIRSGVSPPHCWFCGKTNAWFLCDCRDAAEAREGNRDMPRVVERDGQMLIILDPEVMAREHNAKRKRYVPSVHAEAGPAIKAASVTPVTPVTPVEPKAALKSVTEAAPSVTQPDPGVTAFRTPAAERMRRKRERDKAANKTTG